MGKINSLKKIITFIKGFIFLNIIWFIGAIALNSRVLPNPIKIYKHIPKLMEGDFYLHILASFQRTIIGLLIAIIVGGIIGLLMGYSKKINKLLNPLIYFTYPIPKTALLPVVMILFGLGDTSKITLIVIITVFQVIVSVRDSVSNIPKEHFNPLISLGASRIQIFNNVVFPAILVELLTTIRLSIGTALSVLFFAEAYGTSFGLGYYIQDAWSRIDYISMYGAILMLSLMGFILFTFVDFLQESLCKWKS